MTPLIIRCTNVEDSLKRFFMCLGLYNAKQINEKRWMRANLHTHFADQSALKINVRALFSYTFQKLV